MWLIEDVDVLGDTTASNRFTARWEIEGIERGISINSRYKFSICFSLMFRFVLPTASICLSL
jgi:hypothetical protein